jgi:hypothetical protein
MDQVDVAAERLGRTDGELQRGDLVPERPRAVRRGSAVGIRVLTIALVDEEAAAAVSIVPASRPLQPASMPAEASTTKSAPSAAAKPSIMSATKSG